MNAKFEEVLFFTLTEPNYTRLDKQLEHYTGFIKDLCFKMKTHLKYVLGYEEGKNSHAHFIVSVPSDEVEYFKGRIGKFKPWKYWRFRTLDFQLWEDGHNTYWYTTVKHTGIGPKFVCPGRYMKCRQGQCEHTH